MVKPWDRIRMEDEVFRAEKTEWGSVRPEHRRIRSLSFPAGITIQRTLKSLASSPSTGPTCKALTRDQFNHQHSSLCFFRRAAKIHWSEINMSKNVSEKSFRETLWSIYGWNGMMLPKIQWRRRGKWTRMEIQQARRSTDHSWRRMMDMWLFILESLCFCVCLTFSTIKSLKNKTT